MGPRDVVGHPHVGDDEGVDADPHPEIGGMAPQVHLARWRVGVERQQHLGALAVGIGHGFGQLVLREVQAGKITRVGRVLEPAIDGVGAGIDGRAQGRRRTGGADQFGEAHPAQVLLVSVE